jgi:hypothetical protein
MDDVDAPGHGTSESTHRFPTLGGRTLHPVPDLRRIPREQWRAALKWAHSSVRYTAAQTAMAIDLESGARADRLAAEVNREEREMRDRAAQAAAWPPPLPTPDTGRPTNRRRPLQVSFRLSPEEHGDLVRAADLLGLTHGRAARMVVVRCVRQVLREADPEVG